MGGAHGSGEPAVWTRRLPGAGMLPELLVHGKVDTRQARRIGRTVAGFHASAATGPGIDHYGSRATVAANWDENFDQMVTFVGRTVARVRAGVVRVSWSSSCHVGQPVANIPSSVARTAPRWGQNWGQSR